MGESNNWNISLIGRFGTGLPYTPLITGKQIYLRTNSERRPTQTNVDLLAEKSFDLGGLNLSVFLKVFNLFDILNERLIYTDTGRSTYTLLTNQGSAKAIDKIAENIPGELIPQRNILCTAAVLSSPEKLSWVLHLRF
ncbi:MAG: hypothetical protein MZV64_31140 [Ignavibacteriales bacterium]|nr:hypothetical protein [Ignavibacteriales bacterium]